MAKKCIKGYKCGNSCISTKKQCKIEFPTGVSVALDGARSFINELPKSEFIPTQKDIDFLKAKVTDINYNDDKVKKLMAEGLTEEEANGIALWISFGDGYKHMNRVLYNPESIKDPPDNSDILGLTGSYYAKKGLAKLPKITQKQLKEVQFEKSDSGKFLKKGFSQRNVQIDPRNMQGFMSKYKEGAEVTENYFFATSVLKDGAGFEGTVSYIVKRKPDGKSNGVGVDKYKNSVFEGEVLFPPGQKFKVKKITQKKTQSEIKNEKAYNEFEIPNEIKALGSGKKFSKIEEVEIAKKLYAAANYYAVYEEVSPKYHKPYFDQYGIEINDTNLKKIENSLKNVNFLDLDAHVKNLKLLEEGMDLSDYEIELEEI